MKNVKYFLFFVAVGSMIYSMEKQQALMTEEEYGQAAYDSVWDIYWAPRALIREMINGAALGAGHQKIDVKFTNQFNQLDEKERKEIYKELENICTNNPGNATLVSLKRNALLTVLKDKSKKKKQGRLRRGTL